MADVGFTIAERDAVTLRTENATSESHGRVSAVEPPRLFSTKARRRIIVVANAAITLIAAELLLSHAEPTLQRYDVADYTRKPNVYLSGPPGRILLLGSSRVKYGLAPAEFEAVTGVPAFNLGIPGSKTVEWRMLLRRIIVENPPLMVVLGINVSELRSDYLPTASARNLFSLSDLCESVASDGLSSDVAGAYLQSRAGQLSAAFHRRFEIKLWLQEHAEPLLPVQARLAREHRERCEQPIPYDGFEHPWLTNRQRANLVERLRADPENVVAVSTPEFSLDAPAVRHFAELLDDVQSRGVLLVVVYIPNSPRTERRWEPIERQAMETISNLCNERGVTFIPCDTADIPRTDAEFVEEVHVGLPLARSISRQVAERVVALGLLPDSNARLARKTPPAASPIDASAMVTESDTEDRTP